MAAPRRIDWERIEPDYRAGIKSLLQIADEYEKATGVSVSHTAISKHFKKLGVKRNLKEKVLAKAEAIVSASMVSGKVSIETTATDAEIINKSAVDIATVRINHRSDITRTRKLALDMLSELEHQTGNVDLYEDLGEMLRSEDARGVDKRNDIYHKVISSAGRIDSLKKLAETLKTLIGLEREAYGIGPEVIKTEVEHTGTITHDRPKLSRDEWLKVNGIA